MNVSKFMYLIMFLWHISLTVFSLCTESSVESMKMCLSVYLIGAAEEWVLQGTDQTEGQGGGGERSGTTEQGVWGRSGGNSGKDFGQGPRSHRQLWQGGDQRRPPQHWKHVSAWILDAQSQGIDMDWDSGETGEVFPSRLDWSTISGFPFFPISLFILYKLDNNQYSWYLDVSQETTII